jgi:hypothetical protein
MIKDIRTYVYLATEIHVFTLFFAWTVDLSPGCMAASERNIIHTSHLKPNIMNFNSELRTISRDLADYIANEMFYSGLLSPAAEGKLSELNLTIGQFISDFASDCESDKAENNERNDYMRND